MKYFEHEDEVGGYTVRMEFQCSGITAGTEGRFTEILISVHIPPILLERYWSNI